MSSWNKGIDENVSLDSLVKSKMIFIDVSNRSPFRKYSLLYFPSTISLLYIHLI